MKRALLCADLALLILYPIAWTAPLARAGLLPFFTGSDLTILGGVSDLWASDRLLAALVTLFAIVTPYAKTLLLAAIHAGAAVGPRWLAALQTLGKFSMADVFLLALYIVLVKGVGIGRVETAWGLWLFTALVLVSLVVAVLTPRVAGGGE